MRALGKSQNTRANLLETCQNVVTAPRSSFLVNVTAIFASIEHTHPTIVKASKKTRVEMFSTLSELAHNTELVTVGVLPPHDGAEHGWQQQVQQHQAKKKQILAEIVSTVSPNPKRNQKAIYLICVHPFPNSDLLGAFGANFENNPV